MGRVIIEAQATACPILISSDTGMSDLIIENETGFIFKNNDPQDLAKSLNFILSNYDFAIQVGKNSKNFVKENHSIKNFEFGYKKIFDLI